MFTVGVFVFKDVSCDLNQEGVQLSLVPAVKSLKKKKKKNQKTHIVFIFYIINTARQM